MTVRSQIFEAFTNVIRDAVSVPVYVMRVNPIDRSISTAVGITLVSCVQEKKDNLITHWELSVSVMPVARTSGVDVVRVLDDLNQTIYTAVLDNRNVPELQRVYHADTRWDVLPEDTGLIMALTTYLIHYETKRNII